MTGDPAPVMRDAAVSDVPALTKIWYDGWQDGHAGLVPDSLARHRTPESFAARLTNALAELRVVEWNRDVAGFHLVLADELNQFFLAASARGCGIADVMMADVEDRFHSGGYDKAWLACAIGNDRAARFYEKRGWVRAGIMTSRLPTGQGDVELDVWRYEWTAPADV